MEFDIVLKMMKICFYVILTIVEVLTGKNSDKDEF